MFLSLSRLDYGVELHNNIHSFFAQKIFLHDISRLRAPFFTHIHYIAHGHVAKEGLTGHQEGLSIG